MTRHITKLLLAASALTVLAAAPAAYAAPAVDTKLFASKKVSKTSTKTVKVAERGKRNRADRTSTRTNRTVTRFDRGANRRRATTTRNVRVNRNTARPVRNRGVNRHVNRNSVQSINRGVSNRRGYRTNYRSNLGISFHFGTPGYSAYRWAPTAYSLYRPTFGSYGYYQRSTVCRRVNVEGWYRGHRELISVKQCSNPWNGSYIVQGSERLVGHY